MTLLIGLKCPEGVVLAADGCSTGHAVKYAYARKLEIHHGQAVIGLAGGLGVIQRFSGIFSDMIGAAAPADAAAMADCFGERRPDEVVAEIREAARALLVEELTAFREVQAATSQPLIDDSHFQVMGCVLVGGEPCLFSIASPSYAGIEISPDLPFATLGSGSAVADSFLVFLRRTLMPAGPPDLDRCTRLVLWTMHHAIEANTGGVGPPIQVVTVRRSSGGWTVAELPQARWEHQFARVLDAERGLEQFLESDLPFDPPPDQGSA